MADIKQTPRYDILEDAAKQLKEAQTLLDRTEKTTLLSIVGLNVTFALAAIESRLETDGKKK